MARTDQTVRVFISSTFRDMHAERDHLVTVVFPELRERVERLGLEFFDVDLRWGVPAKDANGETANSWEYCRQWIDRVEPFFVCILGQRYGWEPEPEQLKDPADRQRQQAQRRSITDMEVRHAVLDTKLNRRSYFYLRAAEAPASASEFVDPPPLLDKLNQLKDQVRSCGRPVRNYPCRWTGEGFAEMEQFGRLVLDDLWSGVLRDQRFVSKDVWRQALGADPDTAPLFTDESTPIPRELWEKVVALAKPEPKDPLDAEREQMDAFAGARLRWFQGRTREILQLTSFLNDPAADAPRLAVVAAVPGQGKSALMAKLHQQLRDSPHFVITHFVGATERSASAHSLVQRLLDELDRSGIAWPAEHQEGQEPKRDFNSLCLRLAQRLGDYRGERRILILLDALNQLSDGHDLQWLPYRLGASVRIIVSCVEDPAAKPDSPEQRVLKALASRRPEPRRVKLGPLTEEDVRTIVVAYLEEYCKVLDTAQVDAICALPQARNPLYLLVMLGELRTLGGNDMNRIVGELIASMPQDHPDTVSLFRWVLQRLEVFGKDAVKWWCLYLAHGRVGMASHELADLLARKLGPGAAATALLIERGLRRYLQRRGPQLDFFHGQLRQAAWEPYDTEVDPAVAHSDIALYFDGQPSFAHSAAEAQSTSLRSSLMRRPANRRKAEELVYQWLKVVSTQHETTAMFGQACDALETLLSNIQFLEAKCEAGMAFDLCADFSNALSTLSTERPSHRVLSLIEEALRRDIHSIQEQPEILVQQLYNRLQWRYRNERCELMQTLEDDLASRGVWLHLRTPYREESSLSATVVSDSEEKTCCCITPDGASVVFGSGDPIGGPNVLRVVRIADSVEQFELPGHEGMISTCAVSEDGTLLVSGAWDASVRIWNAHDGLEILTLRGHAKEVTDCDVSACGQHIVSASYDGTVRLWDSKNGRELARFDGHRGPIMTCAITPDGMEVVSAGRDGSLRIWDALRSNNSRQVDCGQGAILCCAVSRDGKTAVTGGADGRLRIWHLHNLHLVSTLDGHLQPINACDISMDGQWLVSASDDKTLRLWDLLEATPRAVFRGHGSEVTDCHFSRDGAVVISCSRDGTVKKWNADQAWRLPITDDISRLLEAGSHDGPVTDVKFSPDGAWAVSASDDGVLRYWSTAKGKSRLVLRGHSKAVHSCAISPDGTMVASAGGDKTIRVWDIRSGTLRVALVGHTEPPMVCAFSPDGSRIVSGGWDGTLQVWNTINGRLESSLREPRGLVMHCEYSPDGAVIVAEDLGRIEVWDVQDGVRPPFLRFVRYGGQNCAPAVSPDGRLLLSAGWSETSSTRACDVMVWDITTGNQVAVLTGHTSEVTCCGFSPDGHFAIAASKGDFTVRTWELATFRETTVCAGHRGSPWIRLAAGDAAIQRFGLTGAILRAAPVIVSAGIDGTLRVWNLNSGELLAMIALPASLLCLALHPSQPIAICGDYSGGVYVLEIKGLLDAQTSMRHQQPESAYD